jgi:putative ABC transport system permease protein
VIRHIFRLVWNRRRANALILVEVLVSFLVLCGLLTGATWFGLHWIRPPGFDYKGMWHVSMRQGREERGKDDTAFLATLKRVLDETSSFPEVEAAALMSNAPYSGETSNSTVTFPGGREIQILHSPVTRGGLVALRLQVVAGRWFEEADEAHQWTPVLLSRNLAALYFGSDDPIGKPVPRYDDAGNPKAAEPDDPDLRVIGVVADVRRDGELLPTPLTMFLRPTLGKNGFLTPETLVLRLRPGTPVDFEETLTRSLQGVAPQWSFRIDPVSRMRDQRITSILTPLLLMATVGLFLILMVGMGLIGVLWQSVSRRTGEIGVRRAMGATAPAVLRQVLGEILALTTLAVVVGSALFLQVPILQLIRVVPFSIFIAGLLEAVLVIYLFVTFCGLYPGWLATRVQPAQALQHE